MKLSFGFTLGVGVLKNIFIPHPKREAKRESHSYENLTWLLVRGGGIKKNILSSPPNEKPNENLVDTNKQTYSQSCCRVLTRADYGFILCYWRRAYCFAYISVVQEKMCKTTPPLTITITFLASDWTLILFAKQL